MFKNNITETGCQRGTDAYQCWLPLQLKSCNIGTRMHKKHKKECHVMLDADAVINNSSQKVDESHAYPDPAPINAADAEV